MFILLFEFFFDECVYERYEATERERDEKI